MNETEVNDIARHLSQKPSDELRTIYTRNDTQTWRPEAFQAIARILVERGEALPDQNPPAPVLPPYKAYFWRRVFARLIDLPFITVLTIVVGIVPVTLLSLVSFLSPVLLLLEVLVGHVIFLCAIVLYDALMISTCRGTIGKRLFCLTVVDKQTNGKASFSQSARRTERMLRSHWYLFGFPVLLLPQVLIAHGNTRAHRESRWDNHASTVLVARRIGAVRFIVLALLALSAFLGIVVWDRINKNATKAELQEQFNREVEKIIQR